jgi:phospholipase C
MANAIQNIFVLMLENRSFDHMLGFSGITGIDASSGNPTQIAGLTQLSLLQLADSLGVTTASGMAQRRGQNWPPASPISMRDLFISNQYTNVFGARQTFRAGTPAEYAMTVDPNHEFPDVLTQLCGPSAVYPPGGAYPPATNGGFVASYSPLDTQNLGNIMQCYSPSQLPVLNTLCQAFAVCDGWHASLPGPTWPNRFFAHAASSGGIDHSPSTSDILKWDLAPAGGFGFANGTIFDRLNTSGKKWRIYSGDEFPVVAALKGIEFTDAHSLSDFASDLAQADYPFAYTFIEPDYEVLSDYKCGTSQHPLDDVTRGEALIKSVYEAVRNSPVWNQSLLIITWDEHGGFFDHMPPPATVAPGDTVLNTGWNQSKFTFEQLGPRVPAVVISPLIPGNLIDHRVYDHSSIPATLEACFGLSPMTQRDAHANNLLSLVSRTQPREDTPATLPAPAPSGVTGCDPTSFLAATVAATPSVQPPIARPEDSVDEQNVPGFLYCVMRADALLSGPASAPAILARFNSIKTRADAAQYVSEVQPRVSAARNALLNDGSPP